MKNAPAVRGRTHLKTAMQNTAIKNSFKASPTTAASRKAELDAPILRPVYTAKKNAGRLTESPPNIAE